MALQVYNSIQDPKQLDPNTLYVAFGGGVGKFGANFTVFSYQGCNIWIDLGIGFLNEQYPGADKHLPNIALAKLLVPDLVIFTHAHEDHIGALPYFHNLIPEKTPIFASDFTHAIINKKLKEFIIKAHHWEFTIIKKNQVIQFGGVELHILFIPHSIPDSFSVGLSYKKINRKIYFSSDFKLQGNEPRYSIQDIKDFGPIDYLFCDSTGSIQEGSTPNDESVVKCITQKIIDFPGRIWLTTFASNVLRILAILEFAKSHQYKIGLLGRSVINYIDAAYESGHTSRIAKEWATASRSDKKALWIIAGCQGNENSALHKLAYQKLNDIQLTTNDLIIYSSSIIPGNEVNVYDVLNNIILQGPTVFGLGSEYHEVHTSGHGKSGDIQSLVSWLRPKYIIPVHGDPIHLYAFHKILADKKQVTIVDSQYVYKLNKQIEKVFRLDNETLFVENKVIHNNLSIFKTRRDILTKGICNIIINESELRLCTIDYQAVLFPDDYAENKKNIFSKIQNIIQYTLESDALKKEKKLKEKIYKVYHLTFNKVPFINIIWV